MSGSEEDEIAHADWSARAPDGTTRGGRPLQDQTPPWHKPLPPTDQQVFYAEDLVRGLHGMRNIAAYEYGRKVMDCVDRSIMSRLIDEMKDLLEEIE